MPANGRDAIFLIKDKYKNDKTIKQLKTIELTLS